MKDKELYEKVKDKEARFETLKSQNKRLTDMKALSDKLVKERKRNEEKRLSKNSQAQKNSISLNKSRTNQEIKKDHERSAVSLEQEKFKFKENTTKGKRKELQEKLDKHPSKSYELQRQRHPKHSKWEAEKAERMRDNKAKEAQREIREKQKENTKEKEEKDNSLTR